MGTADMHRPSANQEYYDSLALSKYIDGAPHLKYEALKQIWVGLFTESCVPPLQTEARALRVLDLGAGEGLATQELLRLGVHVIAVDASRQVLDSLERRCKAYASQLVTVQADVAEYLQRSTETFDVVCAISFLHHIPDYIALLAHIVARIRPGGAFFSFQDPMRYDTLPRFERWAAILSHDLWRIGHGDVIDGLSRRLRRMRGIYLADSIADNVEYHVVRNGVDQERLREYCDVHFERTLVVDYWSTESAVFQWLGTALRLRSSFCIVATGRKRSFANAQLD